MRTSPIIVAVLMTCVLVARNLIGVKFELLATNVGFWAYGWPWTFMDRYFQLREVSGPQGIAGDLLNSLPFPNMLPGAENRLAPMFWLTMIANLVIAIGITTLVVVASAQSLRTTWQFRLRTFLLLPVWVAAFLLALRSLPSMPPIPMFLSYVIYTTIIISVISLWWRIFRSSNPSV